jgi:hypothetical protein
MTQMADALAAVNIEHYGDHPPGMPNILGGTPRGYSRTTEDIGTDVALSTTQEHLDEDTLNDYRKNDSSSPADVLQYKGDHYLLEGHHRAVAARMEGRPLRARVYRPR